MISNIPSLDIDPFSEAFLEDPYPGQDQIREAGPIVWLSKYSIYASCRYEQVREILNDHATYISSAGVGMANFQREKPTRPISLILEADPPNHKKTRTILSRILSPKTVIKIRESFAAEADRLLDGLLDRAKQGETIDVIKEISISYPLKVFPDAVGFKVDERENLLLYSDIIFNSFGPRNDLLTRAFARAETVKGWTLTHCQRDMLQPDGFGDQIYQAADSGEITHDEALMLVRSLLTSGVDTTITGIGNALYCLAHFPDQYARLHADPSLARPAFEESLRLESPTQTFFRTTSVDTNLSGFPIPSGNKVLAFLGGANRDPRQWPNPTQFKIDRQPTRHMALGSGIHFCVGQAIARLEGELILTGLAQRFKTLEIISKPTRRLNNTLRSLSSLPLRLVPA
jgi:hypothetical protein